MNDLSRTGLAALASGGLYLAGSWLAPVAAPFLLLAPLPGLVVAARLDYPFCVLWSLLSAVLLTLVIGIGGAAGFVVALAIPALAMGYGLRNWWSFERTAVAGIACWTVAMLGTSLLAFGDLGGVAVSAREQLSQSLDVALSSSGSWGTAASPIELPEAERQALINGLIEMLPALVILTGAFMVLANLVVVRRLTGACADVNLRMWRTPDALIWALILSGFGMFVPDTLGAVVARNLFAVLLGCYFCQGLSIVSYYFERYHLPRGLQVASYLLIALQHIVTAAVLALGVFDLWGNFRRLGVGSTSVPLDSNSE